MELFKRILLSLFPENIVNQPVNQVMMFVSFIHSRTFFSVINRKIVENFKLNLFDLNLDSLEFKIGFGDNINFKYKDVDQYYYSFLVVSNINGYRFYSPGNIGNVFCMGIGVFLNDFFLKYNSNYFLSFLISIYLLFFIFSSRLKILNVESNDGFNDFINLYFNFYHLILIQTNEKNKFFNQNEFVEIKKNILSSHIEIFYLMFEIFKRYNNCFKNDSIKNSEFYRWLFYDELKTAEVKNVLNEFIENYKTLTVSTEFCELEKKIMNLIFPADIILRYLYNGDDIFLINQTILSEVYNSKVIMDYANKILKKNNGEIDQQLDEFLFYLSDYNLFKENYFKGVKNFTIHKFKYLEKYGLDEEVEEFISIIGEGKDLENIKIPDRIKKESAIMDKLIYFYTSLIGGKFIGRGDNFYFRVFNKKLLNSLMSYSENNILKQNVLFYYGGLLYNYAKCVFFYKHTFDNVKAGKEKFNMPFKSSFKDVYSNISIINLFNENFLCILLQDLNYKDIKLYIRNNNIISIFKQLFFFDISQIINLNNKDLVKFIYGAVGQKLLKMDNFYELIYENIFDKNYLNLKDNIYCLDFILRFKLLENINKIESLNLTQKYSNFSYLGILSTFRETFFGFMLYIQFVQNLQNTTGNNYKINLIKKIYILDVIGISDEYLNVFLGIFNTMQDEYSKILEKWINIDNNETLLGNGSQNRFLFIEGKDEEKILSDISGEDMIWFRSFLKTLTFYNKRFIIPNN